MRKLKYVFALSLVCICLGNSYCSPTGLNIIPTADVLEKDVFMVETPYSGGMRFGPEGDSYVLLQIGAGNGVEVGVDQRIEDGHLDAWMNAKWRCLEEDGGRPAVAIGVQNFSRNTEKQPYLVMSKSFKPARLHAGVIKMEGVSSVMLGFDKTLSPKFAVQADYISGEENGLTAGFRLQIGKTATLWAAHSFPNSSATKPDYFIRLGWNATF
ncbi:MAG: hypothetical protein QHH26_05660 [Armatimonadota bacterium]|nr:hypothetical protein [Armatimonadota bacterium]